MTVLAQTWVGTVPGWLTILGIVILGWFIRGGAAGQSLSIIREERDILAGRVKELEAAVAEMTKRIGELEAQKDVALAIGPALKPITDWASGHEDADERRHTETASAFQSIAEELKAFDSRAETRAQQVADAHESVLTVLNMIADRLGPEQGDTP